jgi:septum formation inhibitor MinC
LKVLEVTLDDEKEFINFFDKNYVFFKHHLISIIGEVNENIHKYLQEKELIYIVNTVLPKSQKSSLKKEVQVIQEEKTIEKKEQIKEVKDNLRVIDTLVRSGQELNISGDLLLLNRVNSGASINIKGNLIVTQIVEGSIRCYGNFMMLQASPKANIIFHDVEVENIHLTNKLNRVELKNNEIIITPVLKETNWG